MQAIGTLLEAVARFHPDHVALVYRDKEWTYRSLNTTVNQWAAALISIGVRSGDRIMMLLPNSPELVFLHFAIIRLGAISVPLNIMYKAYEIGFIGNDTESRFLVAQGSLWDEVYDAKEELEHLEKILVVGASKDPASIPFQDLCRSRQKDHVSCQPHYDDIVSIIYTSGTTGRPKGATQTHRSILASVQGSTVQNKFSRGDRLLCALPLFNNFGLNVVLMSAVWNAATLVLVDRFEARKVLDEIKRHRATYFAGTPTMYSYLLDEYDPNNDDLSSLRVTNSGGSHCPMELIRRVEDVFRVTHLEGYGQTEACGFTTLNPLVGVRKPHSVGPPLANIFIQVQNDKGVPLAPGEVGEVVERGDVFSKHGYWNRADANRETFREGWFHSGDLGYLDEDGYLYIVDRKQDLIITGGQNIYPAEVEEILYKHPKVAIAAVVGVPDKVKGELAKAYIVLREGETATEEEIIKFVRERIAKYKAPRMVEFVKELPLGPTGKVLKRELRKRPTNPLH